MFKLNLSPDDFLLNYWQKKPTIIKNAFKQFCDPLTPSELAGLAMEPEPDSRIASKKEGKWQITQGPFESFEHLGEENWSLLVQGADHWHADCAALTHAFDFLAGALMI